MRPIIPLMACFTAIVYAPGGVPAAVTNCPPKVVTLRTAFSQEQFNWMRRDPDFDSVRNHPRYVVLVEREKAGSRDPRATAPTPSLPLPATTSACCSAGWQSFCVPASWRSPMHLTLTQSEFPSAGVLHGRLFIRKPRQDRAGDVYRESSRLWVNRGLL
jgi:hypothetical protein